MQSPEKPLGGRGNCSLPAFMVEKVNPTKKRGAVKASVYVRFFGSLVVVAKVVEGDDGLFVGWPAGRWKRGGRTQYWAWVRFPDRGFKDVVETAVLRAYETHISARRRPVP